MKHLKKEVARLEAELRSPEPSSFSCFKSLIAEKDLKIEQVCLLLSNVLVPKLMISEVS